MKKSILRSAKSLWKALPLMLGTILLVSLMVALVPKEIYAGIFSQNAFFDSLLGSLVGSVSAGSPIVSYVIGGELLEVGVGLMAVTAFLVSWVTVGVVQFPAEAAILGKRFAFWRNLTAFFLSIFVSLFTVLALLAL